jgi:hypothetical protein
MHFVTIERDRLEDFVWLRDDADVNAKPVQPVHEAPIERGNRLGAERNRGCLAVAHLQLHRVIDEIEIDLIRPQPVRYRRRRQPA